MPLSFILSKVLWTLTQPGNLLVILTVLGLVLARLQRRRLAVLCLAAGLGGLAAVILTPLPAWLLHPLEQRFPLVTRLPERVDGIIVLGGAVQPGIHAATGQPALNDAAERMTEGVRLKRLYPEARLVFTGGSGSLTQQDVKEAPVARALWDGLGLDVADVLFESASRNTFENAVLLHDELKPQPGQVWLLVTSALHMPRSVGVFRRAGWTVLPYPVDYRLAPRMLRVPGGSLESGLSVAELAVHEWIGLAAYRLMGRTDSLYPGPDSSPL